MKRSRGVLLASALLALAPLAVCRAAFRNDLRRARARLDGRSQLVGTACGDIEFADQGSGPALLIVHGSGGGFDQALDFAALLDTSGHRVIAPSRFGYLRTPLPQDASAAAQADAHAALLDSLGVEQASVIGISAGAPSALQFALRHPERTRALVLVVPALWHPGVEAHVAESAPALTELLFASALKSDFLYWLACNNARAALIRGILATPPALVRGAGAEEIRRIDATLEHILPVSARRLGLLNDARVVASEPRHALEAIAASTLLISCADDLYGTYAAARYTASQIPAARFVGYDSGGHLFVGRAAALRADIAAFLDG
jgi:pimeloyl-ACP methyl ester carboxylesterase